ncbi:hypothetical protein ACFL1U_00260 [Patescibacteria group bacterium]
MDTDQMEVLPQRLRRAVLKALAYFDLNAFPLTLLELRQALYFDHLEHIPNKPKLSELEDLIKNNKTLNNLVRQKNGFYYLKGSEQNVPERQRRHYLKLDKWRQALKITKWLRHVPFLEMIAICNTVAGGVAHTKSDIDFFLIARPGRIWMVRLGAIIVTSLIGKRRRKNKISNRACLSFIVTSDDLDLNKIALKPQDPYLAYWITQVSPLWGQATYDKFWQANKKTLQNVPYAKPVHLGPRFRSYYQHHSWLRELFEKILKGKFGQSIEKTLSRSQKKRITKSQQKQKPDKRANVIVSDKMLKFHEIDRRQQYVDKLQKKLDNLI